MPMHMRDKKLMMKYDMLDWFYDENGEIHRYRKNNTPEHDQWLVEHAKENPWILDYSDYSTLSIYAPGSSQYEKYKKEIDKKNVHIAELRKRAGLEV